MRRPCGHDEVDIDPDEVDCQACKSLLLAVCRPVFDCEILPLEIAELAHALQKGIARRAKFWSVERRGDEETDARHFRRLLGAREPRPCGRRGAEKSEELAPPQAWHLSGSRRLTRLPRRPAQGAEAGW